LIAINFNDYPSVHDQEVNLERAIVGGNVGLWLNAIRGEARYASQDTASKCLFPQGFESLVFGPAVNCPEPT
jgi:hypothetical protein